MSRHGPSAKPPRRIDPAGERIKPGDVLVLGYREKWMATRFALPYAHPAQMRGPLRAMMDVRDRTTSVYRLDVLDDEPMGRMFAQLREQGIEFAVWR